MNTTTADPTASTFALPENVGLAAPAPPLEGAALNPVPGWMDVLREQFASVGLALKREGTVVGIFAALFTAFIGVGVGYAVVSRAGAARFLAPLAGYALAVTAHAVWNGSAFFGGGRYFVLTYVVMMVPAFLMLAGQRVALSLVDPARADESVTHLYIVRLAAFLCILGAIVDRNRRRRT